MTDKTQFPKGARTIPPKLINPAESILNHLPAVVTIIVVCLLVGSGAVFLKVKPFFSARAVIKIEPVIPKILYGREDTSITPYLDDFVRTQINIVKSFPVISRAIKIYQEQDFNWQLPGENMGQAMERLEARLDIKQLRDTYLFTVSMTSSRKEGLAEMINSVATAYLDANRDQQLNKDFSRLDFLKKRKEKAGKELAESYSILERISAKYTVGITSENNIDVYLQAIVNLSQQRVKTTSRKIEVESKLKELRNQMERLKSFDISADIDDLVEKDWAIRDNRIQLSRKLQDMRLILAGVKQEHPDRKKYEENLEKLYEVQDNLLQRAREVGEKVLRGKLLSDQSKKILELETEYAAALSTEEKLRSELAEAEQKATDINTQVMKASTLRKTIQRLQDSLFRIDERIDQIEVESRSPSRVTLMTMARKPETPSTGKRSRMMIIVVLFSIVAGTGHAIARDKLDARIHTTQDIERVLGFPATGHIIEAGQDLEQVEDIYRVVLDNPFSQLSEQYKGISLALSMEHERHKSMIYTCFSMREGQGTSSLLINTLCSLTGRKEKKILVDLNVWNPISKRLIPEAGQGLWEVLEGKCNVKDAIVTESEYPFHILPFGNWQKGDKSVFQEFGIGPMLQILRKDYEYIMTDSPPFMLFTDAKFLAREADVVVLVVRAAEVREKELFRAVDVLDKIDVQVISVVLNRVEFLRGRYYKDTMKSYYRLIIPSKGENTGSVTSKEFETAGLSGQGHFSLFWRKKFRRTSGKQNRIRTSVLFVLLGALILGIFWRWGLLTTFSGSQSDKKVTKIINTPYDPEQGERSAYFQIDARDPEPKTVEKEDSPGASALVNGVADRPVDREMAVSLPSENTEAVYPYSLKLSAWRSLKGAQKAISHYKGDGLSPYLVKVDLGKKGVWWRIYMGHYRTQVEAKKAKEAHNLIDSLVKRTPYANLIGVFPSRSEMVDTFQRLEELGYPPYFIKGEKSSLRLFVGAFFTRKGAEKQSLDMQADDIQTQVVER